MSKSVSEPQYGISAGVTYDWTVNVVTGAIFTSIGCIAIVLRVLATLLRKRPVGGDDVAMYLAFAANVGFVTASYISVRWGVGLRLDEVPPSWAINAIKAVYVIEVFYYFSIFLIKMSLMLLYLRVADGLGSRFRKGTIIMTVVIVAHFISTVVVEAVQCIPMSKYWNPTVPGHCINITAFFYSTNVFTIITDCIILALPVPTLWKVNRPRSQRIGLVSAFLVGTLSTIASCIRLYSVRIYTESTEPMRDAAPINYWSFIEVNLGILCASAPAIKPLLMRTRQDPRSSALETRKPSAMGSSTLGSTQSDLEQGPPDARPFDSGLALQPLERPRSPRAKEGRKARLSKKKRSVETTRSDEPILRPAYEAFKSSAGARATPPPPRTMEDLRRHEIGVTKSFRVGSMERHGAPSGYF